MAKDIVDVAISELGYREEGENRTKYGAYTGANGAAWCHSFVSWCAKQAGQSAAVPKTASTSYGMNWFIKKGLFKYKGKYTPKRGDIVYFKTGRSHVGIVEKCSGGTLHTIEGNTSNKVARRSYSLSERTITGYGTPKYTYLNSSSGTPVSTGSSKSKNSKTELKALKKILSAKETKPESLSGEIAESDKLPNVEVVVMVKGSGGLYELQAQDGLKITWERKGTPGKLTFSAIYEKKYKVVEGNAVTVSVDGKNIFYGFIFTRKMQKDGVMEYTCYDQLRYLKNKDTIIYKKKTATQLIQFIAKKFNLRCGSIANTSHKMSAIEDNSTLFDMIQNALDETLQTTGVLYVLYDDVGKIQLKKASNMKVNSCLVDSETGENFTYQTSIDSGVYNQIKLIYENKEKASRDYYVKNNPGKINKWGVLQYLDKISDPSVGKLKSQALLKLYCQVRRSLTISGVLGNVNVRAGSLVPVILDLQDIKVANYMMVEKVTHEFRNHEHRMDLVVSGGDFSG